MLVDLVLKNGKIILTNGIYQGGVAIDEGKIVALAKDSALPPADRIIDVEGKIIMPGIIDAHAHLRDVQRSDWEDFETGTKAAAAGGVTTVLEMPVTFPPTSTVDAFLEKKRLAERKAIVNIALYAGAGSHNIKEIPKLAEHGAIAYKTFMSSPPSEREKEFEGLYVTDDGSFLEVLKAIASTGLISCLHAENSDIVNFYMKDLQSKGKHDLQAYLESRPGIAEAEGIARAALLASVARTRLHICHVCAKEAVNIVRRIKMESFGQITAETCPHYLVFTIDDVRHLGPYAKVNPPIRTDEDRKILWEALLNGTIDIIASDHSPFPKQFKEVGIDDIWKASMGVPGIETMLPVMLTQFNRQLISLEKITKLMSENVARIFGLYPKKGVIQVGSDADIVVVDIKKREKLSINKFYTKAKDIALLYDGLEVQGVPTLTIVNGNIVMEEGEVIGKPGTGKLISRLELF
jgi:dihydropyrimidinase/allantoinase